MLTALSIRDVVLIERLDLAFDQGLTVLTGETGAGKSILLDSLGLALGARAESGLVRASAEQASVTACFSPPDDHAVAAVLDEHGLAAEDEIVLRRIVTKDGRSRAFVNDHPVGVGLLRRIGALLVEVQGQHEQMSLADPASHAGLLDAFGVASPAARRRGRRLAHLAGCAGQAGSAPAKPSPPPNAMRNGCATRSMNSPPWRRGSARKRPWRANASACSRTNAEPRRSPPPWRN